MNNNESLLMGILIEKVPLQLLIWSFKAIPYAKKYLGSFVSLPYDKQEKIFNDLVKEMSAKENINEDDYRKLLLDYDSSFKPIFDPGRKIVIQNFFRALHLRLCKDDDDAKYEYFIDTLDDQSRVINSLHKNQQFLMDFFQQIEPNINWEENRLGRYGMKPSLRDLNDKRIAMPDYLIEELIEKFEENENEFFLISGSRESGKTWLTYILGFRIIKTKPNSSIYYCQVDDNFRAYQILNELEEKIIQERGRKETFLIVDDCHLSPQECTTLLSILLKQREPGLKVIFTSRNKSAFVEFNDNEIYRLNISKNILYKEHAKNIIKYFINVKGINYVISEKELDEVIKKWGANLYIIWLKLRHSWKYHDGQKLLEVDESPYDNHLIDYIWRESEIKLKDRKEIFLYISTLCQFELLSVYELALDDFRDTLDELISKGIVNPSQYGEKDFVKIDQELAELILYTLSKKDSFYNEDQLLQSQIETILAYVKSKSTPPNWFSVFTRLYDSRNSRNPSKSELVRCALTSLWNDNFVYNLVKSNIENIDIIKVGIILSSFHWVEGEKENKKWWEIEKLIEIRNLRKVRDEDIILIKESLASSRTIRKYLPYLRFFNFNNIFGKISYEDYGKILETSNINSIRWLMNDFKKYYNQSKFVITIANSLINSNLSKIINNDIGCLYKLNGLIGNIRQVDPDKATAIAFAEKLKEVDFNNVFLNARYEEFDPKLKVTKIKTAGRVINLFLSDYLAFAPASRRIIVDNISDNTWIKIIREESDIEKVFLLWNIFINNPKTAKRLATIAKDEFSCEPHNVYLENEFSLPIVGIYKLCDIQIDSINPDPYIDLFKERMNNYIYNSKHPQITLILLSMLALKSNLEPDKFKIFKDIIESIYKEKMIGYSFNGDTARKELTMSLLNYLIYDKPINSYDRPDYEIYAG
jgi:hypothetical protein